mmetsp:Transcript_28084/g.56619  ORF Transcript_28084/g.56619 Transcript_28084/m.56619 type:complete len:200 (+) Transcript_28084:38-637(+)
MSSLVRLSVGCLGRFFCLAAAEVAGFISSGAGGANDDDLPETAAAADSSSAAAADFTAAADAPCVSSTNSSAFRFVRVTRLRLALLSLRPTEEDGVSPTPPPLPLSCVAITTAATPPLSLLTPLPSSLTLSPALMTSRSHAGPEATAEFAVGEERQGRLRFCPLALCESSCRRLELCTAASRPLMTPTSCWRRNVVSSN